MAPHTNDIDMLNSPNQEFLLPDFCDLDVSSLLMDHEDFNLFNEMNFDDTSQSPATNTTNTNTTEVTALTYFPLKEEPIERDGEFMHKSKRQQTQSSTKRSEIKYGPVVVRPRKNPAPTIGTGRKPKNAILAPDEDMKREIRRARNRVAAEKCKKKREEIEKGLEDALKRLENDNSILVTNLRNLNKKKEFLQKLVQDHNCRLAANIYPMISINHQQTYLSQQAHEFNFM